MNAGFGMRILKEIGENSARVEKTSFRTLLKLALSRIRSRGEFQEGATSNKVQPNMAQPIMVQLISQ